MGKATALDMAVLLKDSKYSFTTCKLRFLVLLRLALPLLATLSFFAPCDNFFRSNNWKEPKPPN